MRITYDLSVDALAVELDPEALSTRTVKLAEGINADFDERERLITVEVLNASGYYPRDQLEALGSAEEWLKLAKAGKEFGLAHNTLRLLLHKRRLKGRKNESGEWEVTRSSLLNYLESRAPAGRPAAKRKARRPKVRGKKGVGAT